MSNYIIIKDQELFADFVEFLPILKPGECYYVSLFARKKYHPSAHNDKSQCKRFTATSKTWLVRKIKQLELADNAYTNKDGSPVHGDSLALYISINPRSFAAAQRHLLKKLADTVAGNLFEMNPSSLALSAIQKSKSRTVFVDFDFDGVEFSEEMFEGRINRKAYRVLVTRGGFHLLVQPSLISYQHTKTWYQALSNFQECDVTGDNLIPVAGCTQGNFVPFLLEKSQ